MTDASITGAIIFFLIEQTMLRFHSSGIPSSDQILEMSWCMLSTKSFSAVFAGRPSVSESLLDLSLDIVILTLIWSGGR